MENLDLNQGVLCEIENTEYGTVVTFPVDLNLQALAEPMQLFASNEVYQQSPIQQGDSDKRGDDSENDAESRRGSELEAEEEQEVVEEVPQDDSQYEESLHGLPNQEINTVCLEEGSAVGNKTSIRESQASVIDEEGETGASFPELGSIIELETETFQTDDGDQAQSEGGHNKYDYPGVLPKKWDNKKTLALIRSIRKHQYLFKTKSVQRISLWSGISEELCKRGFDDCDRDECRKKWDNLYRTFKKVVLRGGDKVTWELYEPVKQTVKCLNWEENGQSIRKRGCSQNADAAQKIIKLTKDFHETVTDKFATFYTGVNYLENEKNLILARINKLINKNL